MRAQGVECKHLPDIDLSTTQGCEQLMADAGAVDVLVNNAGMQVSACPYPLPTRYSLLLLRTGPWPLGTRLE